MWLMLITRRKKRSDFMSRLLDEKFKEWTTNLSSLDDKLRVIFENIRDIPYYISSDQDEEYIFREGRGKCKPKHEVLRYMFRRLSVRVRYLWVEFNWEQLPIPTGIVDLLEDKNGIHLACEALIDGSWVYVDATWDSGLKDAGFPVNEEWDGKSGTRLAVTPSGRIRHSNTILKGLDTIKDIIYSGSDENRERFYAKFNAWLEEQRKQ